MERASFSSKWMAWPSWVARKTTWWPSVMRTSSGFSAVGPELREIGNRGKSSSKRIVAFENPSLLGEFLQFSNSICGQRTRLDCLAGLQSFELFEELSSIESSHPPLLSVDFQTLRRTLRGHCRELLETTNAENRRARLGFCALFDSLQERP